MGQAQALGQRPRRRATRTGPLKSPLFDTDSGTNSVRPRFYSAPSESQSAGRCNLTSNSNLRVSSADLPPSSPMKKKEFSGVLLVHEHRSNLSTVVCFQAAAEPRRAMLRCNMCGEQAAGSVVVADRCGHVFCTKHIDELASTCVCGEEIACAPFATRRRLSPQFGRVTGGGAYRRVDGGHDRAKFGPF